MDEDVEAGVAATDDVEDVADDGAAGGGDDSEAGGIGRERALAGRVEEALGAEAVGELLEGELEGAVAAWLHGLGDELELAASVVDGDAAADQDGEAVGGTETEELRLAAEEDDRELGLAILEREIDVAGGRGAAVGDLAFDPEVGVTELDALADVGDEGAYAPDTAFLQRRGCGAARLRERNREAAVAGCGRCEDVCCDRGCYAGGRVEV